MINVRGFDYRQLHLIVSNVLEDVFLLHLTSR